MNSESPSGSANPSRRGRGWVMAPLLIFIAMAGLFAFGLTGDPSKLPSALIGRPVPQTEFPPLEGLLANGQPVPGFHSTDLAKGKDDRELSLVDDEQAGRQHTQCDQHRQHKRNDTLHGEES